MTLRSRIERLEASAQDVTRVQRWYWQGSVPNGIDVGGRVIDRLPGEPDDALIDRVSQMYPQVEFTIFKWLDPEAVSA